MNDPRSNFFNALDTCDRRILSSAGVARLVRDIIGHRLPRTNVSLDPSYRTESPFASTARRVDIGGEGFNVSLT
jgi:hypothetical protein